MASTDFFYFLIAFGLLASLIVSTEVLRSKFGVKPEVTRKLVHISTGVFIFFAPYFFTSSFYPALIPALFIPFNIAATRFGWLRSLHSASHHEGGRQLNYGTVYFPIAFFALTVLCWGQYRWVLQTSMLVLGLADAFAALVGENLAKPHRYQLSDSIKSIEGSAAMFVTAAAVLFGCFLLFKEQTLTLRQADTLNLFGLALAIALVATAVEALLSGGLDNLFIPLTVAYLLTVIESDSLRLGGIETVRQLTVGVGISFVFVLAAFAVKFLNASGATATFLLASTVFGMGGVAWTVPIMTFFLLSSALSKAGKARKKKFDLIFEKTSRRDAGQVLANGGTAWLLMILYSYYPLPMLYAAYLGTLAAVQADTWATEIGTMVRSPKPYSVITFKPVPAGESGGVTAVGTLGGLFGAWIIGASAWLSNPDGMRHTDLLYFFLCIGAAGALGSLLDSVLGATLQAQYFDSDRRKMTERKFRDTPEGIVKNELRKGYEWFDNDVVNLACGIAGGIIAALALQ